MSRPPEDPAMGEDPWTWVDADATAVLSPQGHQYTHRGPAHPGEIKALARGELALLEHELGGLAPVHPGTRVYELFDRHVLRRKSPDACDLEMELRGVLRTHVTDTDPPAKVIVLAWIC